MQDPIKCFSRARERSPQCWLYLFVERYTWNDLLSLCRWLPKKMLDMGDSLWPGRYSPLRGPWQRALWRGGVPRTPLWRARREREVWGGLSGREQGGGDLLSWYTSWEEGKEKPGCGEVSPWKPFFQSFPQGRNRALRGGLMGDALGLMEDISRTSWLAACIHLILCPRHHDRYWSYERYAWGCPHLRRDNDISEGTRPTQRSAQSSLLNNRTSWKDGSCSIHYGEGESECQNHSLIHCLTIFFSNDGLFFKCKYISHFSEMTKDHFCFQKGNVQHSQGAGF